MTFPLRSYSLAKISYIFRIAYTQAFRVFPRRPTNEEHSAFDLRSFEPFEVDQKGKTHR